MPQIYFSNCASTPLQTAGSQGVSTNSLVKEVSPSPILASDETLAGRALLNDLRSSALKKSLGSKQFSEIVPEIQRRLGASLSTDPDAIQFQSQMSEAALNKHLSVIVPMIQPRNGILGEFNKVITFTVPVNTGNIYLKSYYFSEPCPVWSGWNSDLYYAEHYNGQRLSNLYEVHIRRDGDKLHYTIGLTHGFVGGLRIGVGGRNFLVFSHDPPPATPTPQATTTPSTAPQPRPSPEAEKPAATQIASNTLSLPPMIESPEDGTLAFPKGASAPLKGGKIQAPPFLSDDLVTLAKPGPKNADLGNTRQIPSTNPPILQKLPDRGGDTLSAEFNSSTSATTKPKPFSPGPGLETFQPLPADGLHSKPEGGQISSSNPAAPLLEVANDPTPETAQLSSTRAASNKPKEFTPGPSWQTFQPMPAEHTHSKPKGGQISSTASTAPLLEDGDDIPPAFASVGGQAAKQKPEIKVPTAIALEETEPAIKTQPKWKGKNITLQPFHTETVETSQANLLRAQSLATLSLFCLPQWSNDINSYMDSLREIPKLTKALDELNEHFIQPGFERPREALLLLAEFLDPRDSNPKDPRLTREALSAAIVGRSQSPNEKPGVREFGLESRMDRIEGFLKPESGLPEKVREQLQHVRNDMLDISRALYWTTQYVYQRQLEEAKSAGQAEPKPLEALARRTAHHPVTLLIKNSLATIFGAELPASRLHFDSFLKTLQTPDPMHIDRVHNLSVQDVAAMESLLSQARQTLKDPNFQAQFTASRFGQNYQVLMHLLTPRADATVNVQIIEAELTKLFGEPQVKAKKAQIQEQVKTLLAANNDANRAPTAFAILEHFSAQMQFGPAELSQLEKAIDRLEKHKDRIKLLLRAQAVADKTDEKVGAVLSLIPELEGSPAKDHPDSASDFETPLTAALDALESEYALLKGSKQIGGAYAAARIRFLERLHANLSKKLLGEESRHPFKEEEGKTEKTEALRARLKPNTRPSRRAPAILPD